MFEKNHEKEASSGEKEKSSFEKKRDSDPSVLRKRTASTATDALLTPSSNADLKPGQSVLEQIGIPDHNGWMTKRGERYNTWKMRYFVLKGPHLYYLKSNDVSVCFPLSIIHR